MVAAMTDRVGDGISNHMTELLKKVETLRAKEKKSARARIFHSIGKVRRSLQMYENSGEGRSSRNAPDLSAHSGSEHRCDQDTSRERQRSKRRKQAQAAAPSEKPDPPAAKGPKETRKKMKQRLQKRRLRQREPSRP